MERLVEKLYLDWKKSLKELKKIHDKPPIPLFRDNLKFSRRQLLSGMTGAFGAGALGQGWISHESDVPPIQPPSLPPKKGLPVDTLLLLIKKATPVSAMALAGGIIADYLARSHDNSLEEQTLRDKANELANELGFAKELLKRSPEYKGR